MRQFLIMLSILNVFYCSNMNENIYQQELNVNKAKWDNSSIADYQFTFYESCYCTMYGLHTIVIKNGTVDSVLADTSKHIIVPRNMYASYPTIDTFFNQRFYFIFFIIMK